MTPAQMLQKRVPPTECCTASPGNDYAASSGLTVYDCLKQKTCPVCGAKGDVSHYKTELDDLMFFYCRSSDRHQFEVDEITGECDRMNT